MLSLPTFISGEHYRELSPDEGKDKYRYTTLKPITTKWSGYCQPNITISFRDNNNHEWMRMTNEEFTIQPNYYWDGCTPKRHINPFGWVGTPDFKQTVLASLIHDAFCQFADTEHFPFSHETTNKIFYEILKRHNFKLSDLYYSGVSLWTLFGQNEKNYNVYSKLVD